MPPSVSTPSTSNPPSLMRRASAWSSTDHLPGTLPHLEGHGDEACQLVERHHVGAVRRRVVGVGMGLEEEGVGACGRRRVEQRWDELAGACARAIGSLAGLLHRMRRVEDDGPAAGRPQPHEVPHIHHEVAVAEEAAPLRDRDLGCAPARSFSTAPRISSGLIHCPFFTFTARPAFPVATRRSVWRHKNAGICSTSATWAAAGTWCVSWTSVRTGRPVAWRTRSSARSPCSRPGPRAARRRERLALSYDAL